jgi:hypothetical protein
MVEKQKRNRTHSQEESKDCRKHERIEEEQKKKTEHILKKKAKQLQKTWRHRRGTEREQSIFSTKKTTIAENMKGSKRNTTDSPKESKNCTKREEIEEEQKRTEEPLLKKKATRSQRA